MSSQQLLYDIVSFREHVLSPHSSLMQKQIIGQILDYVTTNMSALSGSQTVVPVPPVALEATWLDD